MAIVLGERISDPKGTVGYICDSRLASILRFDPVSVRDVTVCGSLDSSESSPRHNALFSTLPSFETLSLLSSILGSFLGTTPHAGFTPGARLRANEEDVSSKTSS